MCSVFSPKTVHTLLMPRRLKDLKSDLRGWRFNTDAEVRKTCLHAKKKIINNHHRSCLVDKEKNNFPSSTYSCMSTSAESIKSQ